MCRSCWPSVCEFRSKPLINRNKQSHFQSHLIWMSEGMLLCRWMTGLHCVYRPRSLTGGGCLSPGLRVLPRSPLRLYWCGCVDFRLQLPYIWRAFCDDSCTGEEVKEVDESSSLAVHMRGQGDGHGWTGSDMERVEMGWRKDANTQMMGTNVVFYTGSHQGSDGPGGN